MTINDNVVGLKVVYPPTLVQVCKPNKVDIFLAGSIEMGKAEPWQDKLASELSSLECVGHVFNPRRADWDSTWAQHISNANFNEQVTWELDHIERSTVVFIYFDPNTGSPISLAELGYVFGRQQSFDSHQIAIQPELVVCCPDGFWRQGNVEIMCQRAGVSMLRTFDEAKKVLSERIWAKHRTRCNYYGFVPYTDGRDSQSTSKKHDGFRGQKLSALPK